MTPLSSLRPAAVPWARARAHAEVLALPVRVDGDHVRVGGPAAEVAEQLAVALDPALARASATGRAGEVVALPTPGAEPVLEVLLVGVGDGTPADLRRAGAALARRVRGRDRVVAFLAEGAQPAAQRACCEGLLLAGYRYSTRPLPPGQRPARRVDLPGVAPAVVSVATTTGRAVARARDLANTPSNTKGPSWLADRALQLAAERGLRARVWDEEALARGGFGALLAVGAGSVRPPRLVQLAYRAPGPRGSSHHVVLVGKGITFDSGGLSLKPNDAMVPMKTDMAGAAAVIATMEALQELGVGVDVTAVLAIAENMPSGSAMRPGDVLTTYDGTTVEVLNTDAEGRLVLADALGYVVDRLAPDVVVDLATLTGAASLGLGRRHAAVFSRNEALASHLVSAGDASGDRAWWMPLVDDYRAAMDSPVADLSNIARDRHVGGGSITAALFLEAFVGDATWAHLDIAGPARADADSDEATKGATGFGARLLLRWLESGAPVGR